MAAIGYESWAYLPVDPDPTQGEPASFYPPMITTMAIDHQASLVFKFATSIAAVEITVETTALSVEQRENAFFYILTGPKVNQFTQVNHPDWELHFDGIYGIFTTTIDRTDLYLKLYYNQPQGVIISKVGFSTL